MSNLLVFANNASSLLASGITNTSTSVVVTAGQGALFPALSAGQVAMATLEDTGGNLEIVQITGRVGDTMTIVRGQENTTAIAFASGSRFELRMTAGVASAMLQKTGGDTLSGTTTNAGVIQQGSSGSIQGGEIAGTAVRGSPGETDNQILVPSGGGAPTIGASKILTAANFVNSLPNGVGVMLTGMICIWSGTSLSVPSGYAICDGTNGTPDLRDQFVLGAGGVLAPAGGSATTTTSTTDPSGSLAIAGTALTVNQLPAHSHNYWASTQIDFGGSSGSPIQTVADAAHGGAYVSNIPNGTNVPVNQQFIQNTGNGDPHTHTLSGSLAHSHTYSLPPYKALFYIMKL